MNYILIVHNVKKKILGGSGVFLFLFCFVLFFFPRMISTFGTFLKNIHINEIILAQKSDFIL